MRGIWQVELTFPLDRAGEFTTNLIADDITLEGYLRLVEPPAGTGTIVHRRELHLDQRVWEAADGEIHALYRFDAVYASAHPEALDPEHLAILHGTVAAKMFDDGALVLDRVGIIASLRWPTLDRPGVRMTRLGSRRKG